MKKYFETCEEIENIYTFANPFREEYSGKGLLMKRRSVKEIPDLRCVHRNVEKWGDTKVANWGRL